MSIDLAALKKALRVDHDDDDDELSRLLLVAEGVALDYLEVSELPDVPAIDQAVIVLVKTEYEAAPGDLDTLRRAAWSLMNPHRQNMGA